MKARRIEKLLVTDAEGRPTGLLTLKDTELSVLNPLACNQTNWAGCGVAAASTVGDEGYERSLALVDAGVDLVVIDTAHGHSGGRRPRRQPHQGTFQSGAGRGRQRRHGRGRPRAGRCRRRCGQGRDRPWPICTTRIVAGVGVPQLTAIMDAVRGAGDVPVIADGGIKYSGDFAKAIAAGASCAMVGQRHRRHRRKPGRGDPVSGPVVQILSRHGQPWRHGARPGRPLFPEGRGQRQAGPEGSRAGAL